MRLYKRRQSRRWGALLKLTDFAHQLTKTQLRKSFVDKLMSRREEDIDHFVNFIAKYSAQKTLKFYLEQLKMNTKKHKYDHHIRFLYKQETLLELIIMFIYWFIINRSYAIVVFL